ncbi:hypothetical protein GCM10017744_099400 [Streptomyces antimycoticus]|uniref:Uncharacterized protein n=1 Tax=Streptomyces antimycoticus TaxID=68175 RepID=A0A4D4K1Z4_9ACTN|nr:hypothetical protein SANT12839_011790 [Streptomyces antimycoticus]
MIPVGVVRGGAVGHLDEQATRLADQQRQQVVRGDQVGVQTEPENAQPVVEAVFPDRGVPVGGPALEPLGAPDVVDQDVDPAVIVADALGQPPDLRGVEMVGADGDAGATEPRDEFGRLLDRLGPVVVGPAPARYAAAAGADDGGAGLAQRGRDPAPGAAGRPGDDGDTSVQCIVIECPAHPMSVAEQRVRTPDRTAVPDQPCRPGE